MNPDDAEVIITRLDLILSELEKISSMLETLVDAFTEEQNVH
jgi:hypothetical protein